ncbi:MAG TPA: ATP-grasp domain-containing protein [Gaiellaceae bacterium]
MTAVLFTCAGQRVDIVSAFGRAGAFTVAADANPLAPALYHADRHALVPRIADPSYVEVLRDLVAEHDVSLVVPLTDLDQHILARADLGATALVPDADVCEAMADKWIAHERFRERSVPTPEGWLPGSLPEPRPFPVLVKARVGFGSRNIFYCSTDEELRFHLAHTPVESFVQKACAGEEYSIDVFSDLDARCLNAIPRTMIESKGGESIKGMTIKDWELIEFGRRVAETLEIKGPANVQCFREPDGSLLVTDVNPRFGGGFPLPHAAGGRYPELALALARGERPEPRLGDFREGVVMTRFFSQLTLVAGEDGALEPFSEELPEPIAEA